MCTRPGEESLAAGYQRSADFEKRVQDAYRETRVSPHWIGHTGVFWYRTKAASGLASFIFVNSEQGIRQPAFDHERLLKSLADEGVTSVQADAGVFPFTWIDPSEDREFVKFRIKGQIWQFDRDGTLSKHDGEINGGPSKPMLNEKPSDPSGSDAIQCDSSITFINETAEPIFLFWINYDGNTVYCATVEAGESHPEETNAGDVWRVSKSKDAGPVASFEAQYSDSIAVIREGTFSITKAIEKSPEKEELAQQASVRDHNVWVRESDGRETQLSTSGTSENHYHDSKIYQTSDSRFAVVWQYTPEQEHLVYQVESSPKGQVQPRLKQFQYLKPGDNVRVDKPKMFDMVEKTEVKSDESLFQNPFKIKNMGWSADGREYRFIYNQRDQRIVRVLGMNTEGSIRVLVEDTSKTFVDYAQKGWFHRIENSDELISASERDGWNHLYLFDLKAGTMKNRITEGKWVVHSIDRVDERNRLIWFKAFGMMQDQDPYHAHLARANFDGSGFMVLTAGDGTHKWKWSPDRKFFIDTWSRVDLAPQTVLRDGKTGRQVVELEANNFEELLEAGWTTPERFEALGRDGDSMIYGIIIRPSGLDTGKTYPVIEHIYAGPSGFSVPKAFSKLIAEHELAELGFIVVLIDGMGTNWRSKAFLDHCYKNLKDAGLPDRIAWMKAASESRPWMDLSRVGIYGGSAGGQNAMSAMLWHGDFYKAAVADCGCHDNRMDKLWWNEKFMGWPVDQSYEDSSNVVHAGKLTGALMLIVGELDDNVDPASTMQVVDALNKADKDYDLLFVPGAGHCPSSSNRYVMRRQKDFFVRHLMGLDPPKRNSV